MSLLRQWPLVESVMMPALMVLRPVERIVVWNLGHIDDALAVTQPNATRICARLSDKGLVRRSRSSTDRRAVRVSATVEGRQVVDRVSSARRAELGRIVGNMTSDRRDQLVEALRIFTAAAGGIPEDGSVMGWGQ